MKTGRLELYITSAASVVMRPALDELGDPIKCETYKRMKELKEKYMYLLKDDEDFTVEENW